MWTCSQCGYQNNPVTLLLCRNCRKARSTARFQTPLIPESASELVPPAISLDTVNLWLTMQSLHCPHCKRSIAALKWPNPLIHLEQCKRRSMPSAVPAQSLCPMCKHQVQGAIEDHLKTCHVRLQHSIEMEQQIRAALQSQMPPSIASASAAGASSSSKRTKNSLYDWTCVCTLRIINATLEDIQVHQRNCSVCRSQKPY